MKSNPERTNQNMTKKCLNSASVRKVQIKARSYFTPTKTGNALQEQCPLWLEGNGYSHLWLVEIAIGTAFVERNV